MTRKEVSAHFADCWWTCTTCHATYPRNREPDYCAHGCGPRLRLNDDVRVALTQAPALEGQES